MSQGHVPFDLVPRLALLSLGTGVTGCTPFRDVPAESVIDSTTDGSAVSATPCNPNMSFGAPILVPGLSDVMARSVGGLRLSSDDRVAYFQAAGRSDSIGYTDLYVATRGTPTSAFGNVMPFTGSAINSPYDEFDPTVSGDGLTLLFARSMGMGAPVHIYYSTRATSSVPFTNVAYAANLNDEGSLLDASPFLREDGRVIYFDSSRVPANSTDIFRSDWKTTDNDATLASPTPVIELNQSTSSEVSPIVTPDDATIYFASDRGDGNARGDYDIWTATRGATGAWISPVNVTEINSPYYDVPTFVTRDGCTLYFASTRDGALAPYQASRGR